MTVQIDTTTASGIILIIGAIATLVGSIAGAVATVINAVASARSRTEVKAAADVAAVNAATAATRVDDVIEATKVIHDKAETAIKQNEQIVEQTNGHYTAMMDLLKAMVDAVNKPPAPVVIASDGIQRRVRATDLDPAAAQKRGPQ